MRHLPAVMGVAGVLAMSPVALAGQTGIAACDAFLKNFQICIDTKAPVSQKKRMQDNFDFVKNNWLSQARTPAYRESLEIACRDTTREMRQLTAALGCQL